MLIAGDGEWRQLTIFIYTAYWSEQMDHLYLINDETEKVISEEINRREILFFRMFDLSKQKVI